eukprot:CAMPEP_0183721290 /NCGR_PEP_ID=MMETSP0737-20130205/13610_1 /TAXON_ID=385413 /ORGANISM="Thalassiosira miniscula, Strain CCMP1093" /LENGTH=540 /DNA_ID=CAMNT_0025951275 /DNA_START=326 /DNA_END=1948 /DNA_ORIENTATION=+
MPSSYSEESPLLVSNQSHNAPGRHDERVGMNSTEQRRKKYNMFRTFVLPVACLIVVLIIVKDAISTNHGKEAKPSFLSPSLRDDHDDKDHKSQSQKSSSPSYTKVQTLSFQIYTGGAPAFIMDESTGKERKNHECKGLHSYGQPEDSETLQCYLGLENTAMDVQRRLDIMTDAVNRAYDISSKDESTLKIFLAPEFYFRGLDGAFEFSTEEAEDKAGECSDICHILKGLENIAAHKRFENWLFLFGTVIASEALPREDTFDYQFYNFAPLYKGFDPATSQRIGKNFIVPKRYVSNIDFLTPLRHLTNKTMTMELLDEENHTLYKTLMNPHASGQKRYGNNIWNRYKDELTILGYNMIEYGWFFMDGISFSVEICLDHLVHRALMTYMADVVTGSKTRIPSSANDSVEWVGIPKHQAQISLVSSAGMDVTVASLALANGGHIFLQDGMEGNVPPHKTYGEDDCQPNEYEFFGGSQCVKRTAVISATDVTFGYEMNMEYKDYDLYPENGGKKWKDVISGLFSSTAYRPKLTVYDPVNITLPL